MQSLFVHQNFPAQFRHVLRRLTARDGDRVVFITQPEKPAMTGVTKVEYAPHRKVTKGVHNYLGSTEAAVINGQGAARAALALKGKGFVPDVMVGHPGWGETLFLKDVFPDVPLISYCEFYYRGRGSDVGFDPEFGDSFDTVCRARIRAAHHLAAIEAADLGVAPTRWQKAQFPEVYQPRIEVIHEGVDTTAVRPAPDVSVTLSGGRRLTRDDEVVTYVARNLEPYRGFHVFMRALPRLLEMRPEAQVLIVGGDEVSYGRAAPDGKTWRQHLLAETGLAATPAMNRVHFLGKLPYAQYLAVLQLSRVHVYLTYPFVLSWSAVEAMSAGCVVLGSGTAPVREVIEDGRNGLLVDFFDPEGLARRAAEVLARPGDFAALGAAARQTAVEGFDVEDGCRRWIGHMDRLARR
jgi:glycosyltransferase involved in cell wall biosynthesis